MIMSSTSESSSDDDDRGQGHSDNEGSGSDQAGHNRDQDSDGPSDLGIPCDHGECGEDNQGHDDGRDLNDSAAGSAVDL